MKKIRKILLGALVVLVVITVLGAVLGPPLTRRSARRSFPQTSGDIHLSGLDGVVEITRDSFGIPHIYASTLHDLFFAQGFVHAQDRFWQMDFWRHQGGGRLSELLGKSLLDSDKFLRTIGWERVAKEELANLSAENLAMLDAYSDGVNAYLADHKGTDLSLEYTFLPILNRNYEPAPWTPLNTLTWEKAMAWLLGGNIDSEIGNAILLKTFTTEQLNELYPFYSFEDRPVIVPDPHITTEGASARIRNETLVALVSPALQELNQDLAALRATTGDDFGAVGSNSWVISGDLSNTGMPLLANDPHLPAQMPSIWYEVGLHCVPKTPDCPYELAGFSFAGTPGIIIGHNDRIAWSFTNVGPDVMDLYIEKINPNNPNQYEFEGKWVDMQVINETLRVPGDDPVQLTVRSTRHGPIITEVYGLEEFAAEAGIDFPENYAISLSWTALKPVCVFCAIWGFNSAQNWDEFRQAASLFSSPAQNLVYADVDGNIGYQMPGDIPIRAEGHSGLLPVPGWTGENEWQGYIPFEELPYSFNPPEGYIVTANNAVVGPEYPYTISLYWAYGERAQRIVDMIENAPGKISSEYIRKMQGDNMSLSAELVVPYLLAVSLDDQDLKDARAVFKTWDFHMDIDSAPAALYAAFWKHLYAAALDDDYPQEDQASGGRPAAEFIRNIIDDPNSVWWDDQTTPEVESRDDILRVAFEYAVDEIEKELGKKPEEWAWGDLHTITFYNQVMSNFPLINTAFNRGPFRTSGGNNIVNATGWPTRFSYEVVSVPSMRMIVDLGDLQNSLTMHTTGQSGHAYHDHYIDMADPWRLIQYHPMHWERAAVEADAEDNLRLVP